MKTFSPLIKFAIREIIRRDTGLDPGRVHPDNLLTPGRGGIHTHRIEHTSRAECSMAVHFLPVHPGPSSRWISFNLN